MKLPLQHPVRSRFLGVDTVMCGGFPSAFLQNIMYMFHTITYRILRDKPTQGKATPLSRPESCVIDLQFARK